jgi:hypothetical protein
MSGKKMIECKQCQSELEVTADSRIVNGPLRCAGCGFLFRIGAEYVSSNRFAWRSLWFGISSILLAFLTGIPAIYYGIRSFIQMARAPARSRDQTAAAVGIMLGCFGTVFVSILALTVSIGVIAAFFLTDGNTDPDEVLAMQQKICSVELPDELKPQMWSSTTEKHDRVYFYESRLIDEDGNLFEPKTPEDLKSKEYKADTIARIGITRSIPQFEFNRANFHRDLKRMKLEEDWELKPIETVSETLNWKMGGEDVAVTKTIATYSDSLTTIRYVGFLNAKVITLNSQDRGMAVIFKTPHGTLNEEKIKAMFGSFGLPKK